MIEPSRNRDTTIAEPLVVDDSDTAQSADSQTQRMTFHQARKPSNYRRADELFPDNFRFEDLEQKTSSLTGPNALEDRSVTQSEIPGNRDERPHEARLGGKASPVLSPVSKSSNGSSPVATTPPVRSVLKRRSLGGSGFGFDGASWSPSKAKFTASVVVARDQDPFGAASPLKRVPPRTASEAARLNAASAVLKPLTAVTENSSSTAPQGKALEAVRMDSTTSNNMEKRPENVCPKKSGSTGQAERSIEEMSLLLNTTSKESS